MNNFTSMVIAILEHLKLLSEDEAKKLADELHGHMLPDTYKGASALLKELYEKIDVKTLPDKVPTTSQLEADMKVLKQKFETEIAWKIDYNKALEDIRADIKLIKKK